MHVEKKLKVLDRVFERIKSETEMDSEFTRLFKTAQRKIID